MEAPRGVQEARTSICRARPAPYAAASAQEPPPRPPDSLPGAPPLWPPELVRWQDYRDDISSDISAVSQRTAARVGMTAGTYDVDWETRTAAIMA